MSVKESDTRLCSYGLELSCDNGEGVGVAFALDCCEIEIMSWLATVRGNDARLVGDLIKQDLKKLFVAKDKQPKRN